MSPQPNKVFSPTLCWCSICQATTGGIMGQVLHGCARTTAAVRPTIQHSQKSLNELAEQYGINPKAVAKWKKRSFANDAPMGPKEVRSTVLKRKKQRLWPYPANSGWGWSCRLLGCGRRGWQRGIKSGIGASPSGKAADFDSAMRRFESSRPSQLYCSCCCNGAVQTRSRPEGDEVSSSTTPC